MPYAIFSLMGGLIIVAAAWLIVAANRRGAAAREELTDRAATHGWRYVRSLGGSKGDFRIEGSTRGTAEWTITSWSIASESRRNRLEYLLPSGDATGASFAIGSAKQLAGLPQFAAFTEQHPHAAKLISKIAAPMSGLLAIVSEGVVEPLGSPTFSATFGAIRTRDGRMPVRMTPELESLFLTWPAGITDPGSAVTAWRDVTGLHVQLIAPADPPFEIIEHLAALGEALGASLT